MKQVCNAYIYSDNVTAKSSIARMLYNSYDEMCFCYFSGIAFSQLGETCIIPNTWMEVLNNRKY